MKRVLVIGSSGAGKSTLAKKLHNILHLPLIHLDKHYWRPGWVRPEETEWGKDIKELLEKEEWIMDGNYQSTLDIRIPRADTIIFMDVPHFVCLFRIIKRGLTERKKREVAPGCFEKLDWKFIRYVWTFPSHKRPDILKLLQTYKNEKEIHVIHSEREMLGFLKNLK
ncbi:MAG: AAA family ATPase [bacterium]|nr:AAA family ATPase [bacterium]